jgi:hypothetical protein
MGANAARFKGRAVEHGWRSAVGLLGEHWYVAPKKVKNDPGAFTLRLVGKAKHWPEPTRELAVAHASFMASLAR